ncbi:MAG: zeta toxin family protein [Candidatus Kerfeldbacteria bacterium]|nr:zeta toxin family protein [Candidatus Kerfeldbacteria bacterium]
MTPDPRSKLSGDELRLCREAERFVQDQWKFLKEKFASDSEYKSVPDPVSLFMAGSPGAGKTEVSKRLISKFQTKAVRIDADEVRDLLPGYNGTNSHIFQSAASMAVNNLFHHCLKRRKNLILDGTFAYQNALGNVDESLRENRKVEIYFIYQDPVEAWRLTKAREAVEHRKVTQTVFISSFFDAITNVNAAKKKFGSKVELNLLTKDYETGFEQSEFNIDKLDGHLPMRYTRVDLEQRLL